LTNLRWPGSGRLGENDDVTVDCLARSTEWWAQGRADANKKLKKIVKVSAAQVSQPGSLRRDASTGQQFLGPTGQLYKIVAGFGELNSALTARSISLFARIWDALAGFIRVLQHIG
jgi:hypothetical protein